MQCMKKYLEDKLTQSLKKTVKLINFPNYEELIFEISDIANVVITNEEEFKLSMQRRDITLFTKKDNLVIRHEKYDIFKCLTDSTIEFGEFNFYQGQHSITRETVFDATKVQMVIVREIKIITEFAKQEEYNGKLNYDE